MTTAAVASATTLADLLAANDISQPTIAAHLDALDSETRVREVRTLSGRQLKKLWQACAGAPAFTIDDLVPAGEGKTIRYAGKNSLPLFSLFEKRFARQGGKVVGYNFQTMSWFTGPGYFTVEASPQEPRELLFDYTKVPATAPAGWPPVKSNAAGASRLVYKDMHDFNRRVAREVIIGSASRLGKEMDSYYVLARI
jgi:hypothetical protein